VVTLVLAQEFRRAKDPLFAIELWASEYEEMKAYTE
jgi:hypothetical protein